MLKTKLAVFFSIATAACATSAPQYLEISTPSGRPEALFLTGDISEAAGQVSSGCMNAGMTVVSNNGYQVVCEVAMNMTQQVMTQLAIGNSYSTTPRQFIQFNLADVGDSVRAQASGWVETQMAFGQMRRAPVDQSIAWKNQMQQALFAVGGVPVPGTVNASREPKIGFLSAELSADGKPGGTGATFVSGIFRGSPAEGAGLQVCDRIDFVNGNKIVNMAGYVLESSKTGADGSIKLSVTRAGKTVELQVAPTTSGIGIDADAYRNNMKVNSEGCVITPEPQAEQQIAPDEVEVVEPQAAAEAQ